MQRTKFRMIRYADAADATQRLRERAHHEVDVLEHALRFGAAQPGRSIRAERVRFVDAEMRAVRPTDVHDRSKRRDVAADRIEPFDDDETIAQTFGQPVELLA